MQQLDYLKDMLFLSNVDFIFITPLNYKTPPELDYKPPSITKPSAGYKKMLSCSVLYVCKSAERKKLQLLRPLQVCRETKTAATTTASSLQREKLQLLRPGVQRETLQLLRPLQLCRERESAAFTCDGAFRGQEKDNKL